MNKKGQFFLIATLVIVGILIMLTTITISTKSSKTKTTPIFNTAEEISLESNSLLNYGVYQDEDVEGYINSLIGNYSLVNPETEFLSIYGTSCDDVTIVFYEKVSSGSITEFGSTASFTAKEPVTLAPESCTGDETLTINLGNMPLTFELNPGQGQNFFIVLREKKEGEEIVIQK